MKRVLFLQIKGKSYAGVWNVNKLVGEQLLKKHYTVHIVSIRNNQNNIQLKHDKNLVLKTINEKDIWETKHLNDITNELKKMHIISVIKIIIEKIKYGIILKKDIKKLHEYIYNYNPDYIITTHYQLLDMIPKEYLKKTIHEQHSSFKDAISNRANKRTFDKYNNKINFLWLTKNTMDLAIKQGYNNNTYIYNAVRFKSKKRADVIENKKLITIARLSKDKSIDKMIDIVESILRDKKYSDWNLEIYGEGDQREYLESLIKNKNQIKLKGLTDNPPEKLLTASINLNTSKYEGFSLSILEANECGVPTISFNFGESTEELIINNETGIIAKDIDEYKEKLEYFMNNPEELEKLSLNAKEFSKKFNIEKIIDKWIELFDKID